MSLCVLCVLTLVVGDGRRQAPCRSPPRCPRMRASQRLRLSLWKTPVSHRKTLEHVKQHSTATLSYTNLFSNIFLLYLTENILLNNYNLFSNVKFIIFLWFSVFSIFYLSIMLCKYLILFLYFTHQKFLATSMHLLCNCLTISYGILDIAASYFLCSLT